MVFPLTSRPLPASLPHPSANFPSPFPALSRPAERHSLTFLSLTGRCYASQTSQQYMLSTHAPFAGFDCRIRRANEIKRSLNFRCDASSGAPDRDITANANVTPVQMMPSGQATATEDGESRILSAPVLENQIFDFQEPASSPSWKDTILRFLSGHNSLVGSERKIGDSASSIPALLQGDLRGSETLYLDKVAAAELDSAVKAMVSSGSLVDPAKNSLSLGQGTWEVFYAPHLSRLSQPLGVRFDPIRYTLEGTKMWSNVRYSVPFVGEGWLSAAGEFVPEGDRRVKVLFNEFWWDIGKLSRDAQGGDSFLSETINSVGRALFFPQFSIFPVLYLDPDFVVFQFTPLQSNIAARRVV